MKRVQVGLIVLEFDNNLSEYRPLIGANGVFYSVRIIRKSNNTEICSVFGETILWSQFPADANINQRKGLTVMTIV